MKDPVLYLLCQKELKMNKQKKCEDELSALKKEFEQFIYIVSHDVKAPLRAISNLTTWIEDDLEEGNKEEISTNFSLLKGRVQRLENMMDALLEISRINKYETHKSKVCLTETINDIVKLIDNNEQVHFEIELEVKNECFETFSKKLNKVLSSLIENAVQFNLSENKQVKIKIQENENEYHISIIDNGPGIPEEVRDKIFTVFYTLSSKDSAYSVGAGLTISRKICDFVGGELVFIPNKKEGSTFSFTWPKLINN
jgi:K+-sensing histidine kinase KdpD